jgi:Uma2 family endonuclease
MTTATLPLPAVSTEATLVTPDDLLNMESRGLFELVDGQLVEKPLGFLSGRTATLLAKRLGNFLDQQALGEICSETTFQCFPLKPAQVRRPDLAFIAAARVRAVPNEGHVRIRPDLAIEVVSPDDGVYDLDEKLVDYRSAGVPLVWVFNPEARIVHIYWPDGSSRTLAEADTLDGGDVMPGFAVVVRELLPAVPI